MRLLTAIVVGIAIGAGVVLLRYGTVAPCGILRQTMREDAARSGGDLGGFLSTITPDSVLNGIIAAQYGAASEGRCLGALLGGNNTSPSQPASTSLQSTPQRTAPPMPFSQEQTAEQAAARFASAVDGLIARMLDASTRSSRAFPQFETAEARAAEITNKMQAYLDQERRLRGPNYGMARSQLSMAISQGSMASNQLQMQIQNLRSQLDVLHGPISSDLEQAEASCRGERSDAPSDLSRPGTSALNAACARLRAAAPSYQETIERLGLGLVHVNAVYDSEHAKQQQILDESYRIQ